MPLVTRPGELAGSLDLRIGFGFETANARDGKPFTRPMLTSLNIHSFGWLLGGGRNVDELTLLLRAPLLPAEEIMDGGTEKHLTTLRKCLKVWDYHSMGLYLIKHPSLDLED